MYEIFYSSGTFIVPCGVNRVRVMAVGGGAGGLTSNCGGGGSGYVRYREIRVAPGVSIDATVGVGNRGFEGYNSSSQFVRTQTATHWPGHSSLGELLDTFDGYWPWGPLDPESGGTNIGSP